jgi:hypothetical protein
MNWFCINTIDSINLVLSSVAIGLSVIIIVWISWLIRNKDK